MKLVREGWLNSEMIGPVANEDWHFFALGNQPINYRHVRHNNGTEGLIVRITKNHARQLGLLLSADPNTEEEE